MKKILLFGAILAIALGPSLAQAQTPRGLRRVPQHDGFWIGFGAGGGWEDTYAGLQRENRGGSLYIRMGGTPNSHILLGVEALAWFDQNHFGAEASRTNVMAITQLYPTGSALFLKGGFGFASYDFGRFLPEEGVGTTVGVGIDFRLGRNFYLTPNVDLMTQFLDQETVNTLLVTVGVTWH